MDIPTKSQTQLFPCIGTTDPVTIITGSVAGSNKLTVHHLPKKKAEQKENQDFCVFCIINHSKYIYACVVLQKHVTCPPIQSTTITSYCGSSSDYI
jgi:hypothetical protein